MRVVAGLFHSVDGVVEAPNEWQFDAFDDELGAALGSVMTSSEAVLMGRVGYEQWSQYWPGATDPFANFINTVPKHVASRTLTGELSWQNSTLVSGDLLEFVRARKAEPGGDLTLVAGISLVRQVLFAGLLDSLTLITHPVIAGRGRRLFEPGDPQTRLVLQEGQLTTKGNIISSYGVRGD